MNDRAVDRMRCFWDEAARRNAPWYLNTTVDYSEPDMTHFFEAGKAIVADALDNAPVQPRGSGLAVEIGAGLGRNCVALTERFDEVVGVDVSSVMVERAHELVDDPRIRFLVGDGSTLHPLENASADLILSFTVFQHIPKVSVIEGYLREAARVLRPGGVLVFQWNSQPGALSWRLQRVLLAAMRRSGIRRERYGRNVAELLGSRVRVGRVERVLASAGLCLRGVRGEQTLFTLGWAERT